MGLFGSKENPEDMKHNAMSMMERNQPKAAVSLYNKILKQNATAFEKLYIRKMKMDIRF